MATVSFFPTHIDLPPGAVNADRLKIITLWGFFLSFFLFYTVRCRHLESKAQWSKCFKIIKRHNENMKTTNKLKGNAMMMFLVDYDMKLAHVSLCHAAKLQHNGAARVSPVWRLAAKFLQKINNNLRLARAINVLLSLALCLSSFFSSAVFPPIGPQSDA